MMYLKYSVCTNCDSTAWIAGEMGTLGGYENAVHVIF